jgi:6,7-dimethyl-8-ribityllumazine synthase
MAQGPRVLIVEARYYEHINDQLLAGAVAALEEAGATHERIVVPGAFEIPGAIRFAVKAMHLVGERRRYDAYVALGCVIRGETSHYDHICEECARGLMQLTLDFSIALGFGVLTVENEAQALERAAVDRKNKGGEAARAALRMLAVKQHFGFFPR